MPNQRRIQRRRSARNKPENLCAAGPEGPIFETLESRQLFSGTPVQLTADLAITSQADVVNGGSPGVDTFDNSEVLSFADATYDPGPGGTSGTFASVFDINDHLTGDFSIDAFHHVTTAVTVGDIDVEDGDVILSLAESGSVSGTAFGAEDLLLFRPDAVGNFASGTVSFFIDTSAITGVDSGTTNVSAVALVERDVAVGDANLNAGDLLIARETEDVLRVELTAAGSGTTGNATTLLDGTDFLIIRDKFTTGLHVASEEIVVGDVTLTAGTLLISNARDTGDAGDNGNDIFQVNLTTTGNNTNGTRDSFFDGSDVFLNTAAEDVDGLSLFVASLVLSIDAPSTASVNEDTALVFDGINQISVDDGVDADARVRVSLNVANGTLSLSEVTGLTFLEGANATGSFVIDGLESDVNNALDALLYTPGADYNGPETLNITTAVAADLIANYTFETNADDQSAGTAYDGTLNGGAAIVTDAERGSVLSLDGNSDYVEIAGLLGEPASVTLAAHVNLTSTSSNGAAVISVGRNPALFFNSQGFLTASYESVDATFQIQSTEDFTGTGWRHVALSIDTNTSVMTLFVDGRAILTSSTVGSIAYGNNPNTAIGRAPGTSIFDFGGQIDDARVYGRSLSPEEIAALAHDETAVNANVAITVDSVNDAPTITDGPDTSSLAETDAALTDSGTFTVSDPDQPETVTAAVDSVVVTGTASSSLPSRLDNTALQAFLSVSPTEVLDGTQTTNTLTWNFSSGTEAFNFLGQGETLILTYTVSATDDAGMPLSDTETVTVTITGTNDAPAIAQLSSAEDDAVAAYDFENGTDSIAPGGPAITVNAPVTISDTAGFTTGSNGLLFPTGDNDSSTNPVSIGTIPGVATSNAFSFSAQVRFDVGVTVTESFERIFDFGGGPKL